MTFRLDDAIEVLERTPVVLERQLGGLSEGWVRATEGPETWSPFVVVGHLIHGEETHLVQVARVMAKRYREAVGPWAAYLSVMQG